MKIHLMVVYYLFPSRKIQVVNHFPCLFIQSKTNGNSELSFLSTSDDIILSTCARVIDMWGKVDIDGYICESATPNSSGRSPSAILSEYFGRPVHLTVKGNKPRACDPTDSFPALKATAWYQDQFPLLVLSEESIDVLHEEIRSRVGTLGIEDQWSERQFVIER
jgi:uncharacterized protein